MAVTDGLDIQAPEDTRVERARPKQKKMPKVDRETLIKRVRERYKDMVESDRHNRRSGITDLKFVNVPGEQWDANQKELRGNRPCYEFNKLKVAIKRVINDIRANRPQGKVRPVEDSDKDTAEIREGLIRNIWNLSDGDTVLDYEAQYQVTAGMGAWQIVSDYCGDDVFDQELRIVAIKNPFCLYADNNASDMMKRDAEDWILTTTMADSKYERKYKKAQKVDFGSDEFDTLDTLEWFDTEKKTTRVAHYWWKEYVDKELALLDTGETVDLAEFDPAASQSKIVKQRTVKSYKIMSAVVSGNAILEPPKEEIGTLFPFVMLFGEWICIEGKVYWWGLGRDGKDAQRSYNVSRTSVTESIAAAPQAKYWVTAAQALGLSKQWKEAHDKNIPFMVYNHDDKSPGPPQRMGGADVPAAAITELNLASEEIKAVTGVYDARETNARETSGKAINARQQQGEIANFNFADNVGKAQRLTWEICNNYIPYVYDTRRTLRILGADMAEKFVKVNQFQEGPDGEQIVVNDLTKGKFDITMSVGPSFQTQRQEASETYTNMAKSDPLLMPTAGDLVYQSMDLPYAEQIAERRRAMLPPQIQALISKDKPMPPEVQAAMMKAEQAMAQVQQQAQLVQEAAKEADQKTSQSEKVKSEVDKAISQLKVEEAQFEAKVAKELARIQQAMAQLQLSKAEAAQKGAQQAIEQGDDVVTQRTNEALQVIEDAATQFAQFASDALAAMDARREQPAGRRVLARRMEGNELIATVQDVDAEGNPMGEPHEIRLVRNEPGPEEPAPEVEPVVPDGPMPPMGAAEELPDQPVA